MNNMLTRGNCGFPVFSMIAACLIMQAIAQSNAHLLLIVFMINSYGIIPSRLSLSFEEPPHLPKSRVFFLNISWFGLNVMYLILSVEGKKIHIFFNK